MFPGHDVDPESLEDKEICVHGDKCLLAHVFFLFIIYLSGTRRVIGLETSSATHALALGCKTLELRTRTHFTVNDLQFQEASRMF